MLNGLLDDEAAEAAGAQLLALEGADPDAPARLYVSSPGGDLTAGLALAGAVASAGCPVWTLCMGQARGAALLVAASGTRGRRYALPHTYLSLELLPPSTATAAVVSRPEPDELARLRGLVAADLAARCGRAAPEVEADLTAGRVLSAEEAVAYGLIDQVVSHASDIR
jgi:ATP-dependent Clp protease protease subunit